MRTLGSLAVIMLLGCTHSSYVAPTADVFTTGATPAKSAGPPGGSASASSDGGGATYVAPVTWPPPKKVQAAGDDAVP